MKTSGNEPFFDIHPVTGACIEVFYADNRLVTFGRGGSAGFGGFASAGSHRLVRQLVRLVRATQRIGTR